MALEKWVKNQAGRAIDTVQNLGDKFSSTVGSVQGYLGSAFEVAKNGETFVGINYDKVSSIRGAIKTYVGNVQTELGKLNTEASTDNAVKGEDVTKAIAQYVAAVDKVAQAYVSALLAYSDKMYEYAYGEDGKGGMQQSQSTLSESISTDASGLSESAEVYQSKYDY